MNKSTSSYNIVAITLHWMIALLIIGLLIAGNFMVRLEDTDPLRYVLTQWHKSLGVIVLLLVMVRIGWRLLHRPPPLPETLESWEALAAHGTHLLLYVLMLAIPLSGWIMVSASPLEIPTLLFNGVEWPHLPPFESIADKAEISELFASLHEIFGWVLVAFLLAHVGAAFRHQWIKGDDVLQRMSPRTSDRGWHPRFVSLVSFTVFVLAALIIYGYGGEKSVPIAAGGNSHVSFEFVMQGDLSEGVFNDSTVEMALDPSNPEAGRLQARVNTASVDSGNSQIDSTLTGSDWFDVSNHPDATFNS
ncbi:MAG: cytochrome b/b6 domain-containing protein [Pseudomonadota bacterium]